MNRAKTITFDDRVNGIVRTRRKMARGAEVQLGPDGLLTARPRRAARFRFPWTGLALCLAVVLLGKAALLAHLGSQTYDDKLADLRAAGGVESAGAWVMQPDWVTRELAARLAPYL